MTFRKGLASRWYCTDCVDGNCPSSISLAITNFVSAFRHSKSKAVLVCNRCSLYCVDIVYVPFRIIRYYMNLYFSLKNVITFWVVTKLTPTVGYKFCKLDK